MTVQLYGIDIKLGRRNGKPAIVRSSFGVFALGCNAENPKETFLVPLADLPF